MNNTVLKWSLENSTLAALTMRFNGTCGNSYFLFIFSKAALEDLFYNLKNMERCKYDNRKNIFKSLL